MKIRSSALVWLVPLAAAASILLTYRMWASPGGRIVAGNPNDVALSCWFLKHTAWSITHLHNPLVFDTMNAPDGINAMWNTSLLTVGILMTPVTLLAGSVVSYNVLLTASFALSTVTAFLLLKRFVTSDAAAAVGAFVYGFSPAMIASSIGHLQIVMSWLAPLLLLLVLEAVAGTRRPAVVGALLGVTAAAQLLLGEEVLFLTAFAALVALLFAAINRPRAVSASSVRLLKVGGVAAAVFLVLCGYPLWLQFLGPLHQHGSAFNVPFFDADLKGFVEPSSMYWISSSSSAGFAAAYRGGAPEYMAYLGWPAVIAAITVVVWRIRDARVRVTLLTAAVLALASLGGMLLFGGSERGLHLPWGLLWHLPVFESALPDRFALMIDLAVGILLALGLDAALRRADPWIRVPAAIGAAAVLVSLAPKPFASEPTPAVPDFFTDAGASIAAGSTIVVLPFPSPTETRPLYWQAASDMRFKMPGGIFIGPAPGGQAFVSGPGPRGIARILMDIEQTGAVPAITDEVRTQMRTDLDYWRADAIVLGPGPNRTALREFLRGVLGADPVRRDGVLLWRL
ncbi:MAG: hypothetical protein ABR600_06865 [Actinomycetota bacterium]